MVNFLMRQSPIILEDIVILRACRFGKPFRHGLWTESAFSCLKSPHAGLQGKASRVSIPISLLIDHREHP